MVRGFRHLILAALATAALALFAPSAAYAAVTPGAFCKKSEIGQHAQVEGKWYQCTTAGAGSNQPKWMPSGPPPNNPGPNNPGPNNPGGGSERKPDGPCLASEAGQEFSTPGKLYVCQAVPGGGYRWKLVTGGDDQPGTLPKTGVNGGIAAGAGAALLAGGGLLFWTARRRRFRFQA